MFDTIGGLPLHPLVVHLAVVALPASSLALILMACWPTGSRRFGGFASALAALAVVAAVIAKLSGQALAERVGLPDAHVSYGNLQPWFAVGQLGLTVVLWLIDRAGPPRPGGGKVFAAVAFAGALVTFYWTYRTGQSGAEAVWGSVVENTSP